MHSDKAPEPLYLSCSEVDHTFGKEARNEAVDLLQAGSKTYHLQLFSGVEHGFALRGNVDDPYESESSLSHVPSMSFRTDDLNRAAAEWVKEQSLKGIVAWFDFWLSR